MRRRERLAAALGYVAAVTEFVKHPRAASAAGGGGGDAGFGVGSGSDSSIGQGGDRSVAGFAVDATVAGRSGEIRGVFCRVGGRRSGHRGVSGENLTLCVVDRVGGRAHRIPVIERVDRAAFRQLREQFRQRRVV
eukprot:4200097-Pleurochrysis_carterae.AAC.1